MLINLVMGTIFAFMDYFFYLRARKLQRFHANITSDLQNNQHLQGFLRMDLTLVLGACLICIILLSGAISRVFSEGYPIFG
jgi:hypothetical protein